jgi:hypothetical protein
VRPAPNALISRKRIEAPTSVIVNSWCPVEGTATGDRRLPAAAALMVFASGSSHRTRTHTHRGRSGHFAAALQSEYGASHRRRNDSGSRHHRSHASQPDADVLLRVRSERAELPSWPVSGVAGFPWRVSKVITGVGGGIAGSIEGVEENPRRGVRVRLESPPGGNGPRP